MLHPLECDRYYDFSPKKIIISYYINNINNIKSKAILIINCNILCINYLLFLR